MRAPSTQTRILAFAPIQLCAWASALFFGYHYFHGAPVFWPVVITVAFLLNVIRAHEQVQAYKAWKREWDAMSGIPPRLTRWPRVVGLALVGVPLIFLFYDVGQHGGASALLGVVLLFTGHAGHDHGFPYCRRRHAREIDRRAGHRVHSRPGQWQDYNHRDKIVEYGSRRHQPPARSDQWLLHHQPGRAGTSLALC